MTEVSRDEYSRGQQRIHERIDKINESSVRVEASTKHIEALMTDIHKVIYGNGRNGLKTQQAKLSTRVIFLQWLVGAMLAGIIGVAGYIIRTGVVR